MPKGKKVRNDAQGKCANILKAKCANKCAQRKVYKRCECEKAALVHRPQGKETPTMCFECE
jgi:hypothetical protein